MPLWRGRIPLQGPRSDEDSTCKPSNASSEHVKNVCVATQAWFPSNSLTLDDPKASQHLQKRREGPLQGQYLEMFFLAAARAGLEDTDIASVFIQVHFHALQVRKILGQVSTGNYQIVKQETNNAHTWYAVLPLGDTTRVTER